jgi:hypothetical protein
MSSDIDGGQKFENIVDAWHHRQLPLGLEHLQGRSRVRQQNA